LKAKRSSSVHQKEKSVEKRKKKNPTQMNPKLKKRTKKPAHEGQGIEEETHRCLDTRQLGRKRGKAKRAQGEEKKDPSRFRKGNRSCASSYREKWGLHSPT